MASVHYAERIFDCVSTEDIENGTFGYMDGLADNESAVYNFVKGTKSGETVVVADQPAWTEDTCKKSNQRKDKFIIPAGTRFRVRVVKKSDEFAVSIDGITVDTQSELDVDVTANDVFVTIDPTTGKLVASATSTPDAIMEAKVMRKRMVGGMITTLSHNYGYSRVMYEAKIVALA